MRGDWRWVIATAVVLAVLIGEPVLAGSGVGGVFNLGVTNTVSKVTALKGSATTPMLRVTNDGSGPALSLNVKSPGTAPMVLDAELTGLVANLNADRVDGQDAHEFVTGPGRIFRAAVEAFASGGIYDVGYINDFWYVGYFCPPDAANNGYVRFFNWTNAPTVLFVDQGLADPSFEDFPYPGGKDIAANRNGEWIHIQLYSPSKGIADIEIFSAHRANTCHIQLLATMSTP